MENLPTYQQNTSVSALVFDPESLNSMMAVANIMASGVSTVPKHLQKNAGDCLAIVMQAVQWGMNPFSVAQKTHLVNGTLGYEAQLVNSVAIASKSIKGHFHYEYTGDGEKLTCRVGAILNGEDVITWGEPLMLGCVTIRNSPLWKTNPKQQIGYLQVKNWCRAFCPEAIMGVYTSDELEEKDVTPYKDEPHTVLQPAISRTQAMKNRVAEKAKIIDDVATQDGKHSITEIIASLLDVDTPEQLKALDNQCLSLSQEDRSKYAGARKARLKQLKSKDQNQEAAPKDDFLSEMAVEEAKSDQFNLTGDEDEKQL